MKKEIDFGKRLAFGCLRLVHGSFKGGVLLATHFGRDADTIGAVVGVIQIRQRFNKFLEKYAGHIGYCVRPSERRKGYASKMLALALAECGRLGIYDVLVCCLADNEASRRTILKNGGAFESTVFEPRSQSRIERYWIRLPR